MIEASRYGITDNPAAEFFYRYSICSTGKATIADARHWPTGRRRSGLGVELKDDANLREFIYGAAYGCNRPRDRMEVAAQKNTRAY